MFHSLRLFPFAAALTLGLATVGCAADADPVDADDMEVESTEDAIVGDPTATIHKPKPGSQEYNAILKGAKAALRAEKPYDHAKGNYYDTGEVYRMRSAKGWAYIVVQDILKDKNGISQFGDSSTAILLQLVGKPGSLSWTKRELLFQGPDEETPHEKTWEKKWPAARAAIPDYKTK